MTTANVQARPRRISALSLFFGFGAAISFLCVIALLFPGGLLEPMWRLNPRAHSAFVSMGPWAIALLVPLSAACGITGAGLWYLKSWGYYLAIVLLLCNLIGDLYNTISGTEPRAAIGIPVVITILFFITRPAIRSIFRK